MFRLAVRRTLPLIFCAIWGGAIPAQEVIKPRTGLEPIVAKLEAFIEREMKLQNLPSVSMAIVEGREITWARGFGKAKEKEGTAASAETLCRVGSVSKLFTDLAVMQLVEKGELDLDAPVTRYLPDFAPKSRFDKPITLRHLMSHRAGLVRESPVGNYFDPTEPSLAATVASLNSTELIHAPGTREKYSNAGIAVVGRVVEKVKGEPFAKYVKRAVLEPLKLHASTFEPTAAEKERVADSVMWTYDGRTFPSPTFLLGTGPAGNLYSNSLDMGRFIIAMLDGGTGAVKPETLKAMWTPQFAAKDAKTGFGIGFNLALLDGHRHVGHNGAIYGFATDVSILPDDQLGVVVIISKDCANSVAGRISNAAFRLLLAQKQNAPLPSIETTEPLASSEAQEVDGVYKADAGILDLVARDGRLFSTRSTGGLRLEVRKQGDTFVTDDTLGFGTKLKPTPTGFTVGDTKFAKVQRTKPAAAPDAWRGLIGEYGWDHNTLFVLENDGKLFVLIEWFFLDRLEEVSPDVFRFPDNSRLYASEHVRFKRDETGRAVEAEAAGVKFARRKIDGDDGTTFHITPMRPVAELRPEALKGRPPLEPASFRKPELVELVSLDPTIKLDIRYATNNNFLQTPFYSSARAFMQRSAAEALVKAHKKLKERGLGLLIHDAYRPWYVTKMFWDATPQSGRGFVANPAKGSKHNRGCAVDLTLYDLSTGKPIEMVGGYDEFSSRSSPDYPGGTSLQRWHRDLLRRSMEAEGFTVNEVEWWHFDFRDWAKYPILNAPFEEISQAQR